jgi:hypothetical protein
VAESESPAFGPPTLGGITAAAPGGLILSTRWHRADRFRRYTGKAVDVGFTIRAVHDWTRPVLGLPIRLARPALRVRSTEAGRRALRLRWPGLRELTRDDWRRVDESVRAHLVWGAACRYSALVLDKPDAR